MKQLLLVFIGGGLGSALRYALAKYFNGTGNAIPYGTWIANVVGSLLIGLILGYALKNNNLSQSQTLVLATGFCGGFTTFSTFAYENVQFLKAGDYMNFTGYLVGSFVLGISAVFLGLWLVK